VSWQLAIILEIMANQSFSWFFCGKYVCGGYSDVVRCPANDSYSGSAIRAGLTCLLLLCLPSCLWGQSTTEKDRQDNQEKSRTNSLSSRERAAQIRQPTAPTDAKALADRPPKPQIVGRPIEQGRDKFDLTFDDLAFEIPKGEPFDWSMLSPEIHQYDGKKITLRGYIKPSFTQKNIKQFVFVRDNQECCFGPGAALFDCVLVKLTDGRETNYTVRPVTVEGEFYLRKYAGPDGNVWAIYRIREGIVK